MNFPDKHIFRFIKQYPRISLAIISILVVVILFLPISFKEKLVIPVRSAIVGCIIAVAWMFYKKNKDK